MSEHTDISELKPEFFNAQKAANLARIFGAIGLLGLLISAGFGIFNHKQFAYSWLFAFTFFFTICCGALFWVLVHHATDSEWSVLVRRQLENVAWLIPVLTVFFLVMTFAAPLLYKWWTLPPGADSILDKKSGYLNSGFFWIRAVIYFGALSYVAYAVRKHSISQDSSGHPIHTIACRRLSFAGIPIVALAVTFGAVDWLMSLDHHWFSTMWGVYIFAGSAGSAMCLLVLIITFLKRSGNLPLVQTEHYHIMGKLMLAFTVFWAYIGYSQYMLIWYVNLPEETTYFIQRNTESWWYLSVLLVVGRFFIPFPFLLFQATKKNPVVLCCVAGWILLMQLLDIYIVVLPALHNKGFNPSILDLSTLLGIGGILGYFFLKRLPKTGLFPIRDPRIKESINLSN